MKKPDKYHPDYNKLYPGVELTPEVKKFLRHSDRKMEYMEVDLKQGTFIQKAAEFLPSREDSLDRLIDEEEMDFASSELATEEIALHNDELDRLKKSLSLLPPNDRALIKALFYDGLSEREYATRLGLSQKAVNKRWHTVREKLKKLMKI